MDLVDLRSDTVTQPTPAMREAIGADSDRLTRAQVEQIYPRFRGRFWTGHDASNNQRFGPMFFPYLEHAAISNTAKIPIRFKDLGLIVIDEAHRAGKRYLNLGLGINSGVTFFKTKWGGVPFLRHVACLQERSGANKWEDILDGLL